MSYSQGRRDERHRIRIPLRVYFAGSSHECTTQDISYGGMFVRCEQTAPQGQLVRLEIPDAGPGGATLKTTAVVAHASTGGGPGRPPGMGLQLYGIGREDRVAWVRRVDTLVAEGRHRSEAPVAKPLVLQGTEEVGARGPIPARLDVTMADPAELNELYSRLVTSRAIIVETPMLLEAEQRVRLILRHPGSSGPYVLEVMVRRRVRDTGYSGYAIELIDPDGSRAAALWRFISESQPQAPLAAQVVGDGCAANDPFKVPFTDEELDALAFPG